MYPLILLRRQRHVHTVHVGFQELPLPPVPSRNNQRFPHSAVKLHPRAPRRQARGPYHVRRPLHETRVKLIRTGQQSNNPHLPSSAFQVSPGSSPPLPFVVYIYISSLSVSIQTRNTINRAHEVKQSLPKMMMSMFSSFEALCAESSFGQKLSFSTGTSRGLQNRNKDEPATVERERPKQTGSTPPKKDVGGRQKEDQPKKRPRFAPELDGVHCFETIIPY